MKDKSKILYKNLPKNLFRSQNAKKKLKEIQKQLLSLENNDAKNLYNTNSDISYISEQKIVSIIKESLQDKADFFQSYKKEDKDNLSFSFESFIYYILDETKSNLHSVIKSFKNIDSIFKKINSNTIMKIQSIIINYIKTFYDFYENDNKNYDDFTVIITIINSKENNLEDSYIISLIKLIILFSKLLNEKIFQNIIEKDHLEYGNSLNALSNNIIKILNTFELISKTKTSFNDIGNNFDFEKYIKIGCENTLCLSDLLFEVLYKFDTKYSMKELMKNDELFKMVFNTLSNNKYIRKKIIYLLSIIDLTLSQERYKELLKLLKKNNSLMYIIDYINKDIDDIYNKSDLLEELETTYKFYLLSNLNENYIEMKMLQILTKNKNSFNNDDFSLFVTNINSIIKVYPKLKHKVYYFLLIMFNSLENYRGIISQTFLDNFRSDINAYVDMYKNVDFVSFFIDNLRDEIDSIKNFFIFLESLDKKKYLPKSEILKILALLPSFSNINSLNLLLKYLKKWLDINNLKKNKTKLNYTSSLYDTNFNECLSNIKEEDKDEDDNKKIEKYKKFINDISKNYIDILYNIILEVQKKFIISFENKVPSASLIKSSVIATQNDNNKFLLSTEMVIQLINFLKDILNNNEIITYFDSKKFFNFFPSPLKEGNIHNFEYKIFEVCLFISKNQDSNQQQIIVITDRYKFLKSNSKMNEILKLSELLSIFELLENLFIKDILNSASAKNLNENIINIIFEYYEIINNNKENIYKIYDEKYHELIVKYINITLKIFSLSNYNMITKTHENSPQLNNQKFQNMIYNIIYFYTTYPLSEKKDNYFLDIIKFLLNKSFNLDDSDNSKSLSNVDFISFYINKYQININSLNEIKNIYSNLYIHCPSIIILLLKILTEVNYYEEAMINFIKFLFQINTENIKILVRHGLLKIILSISLKYPSYHNIIFLIFEFCFKFLEKKDLDILFQFLIKLSNTNIDKKYTDYIKQVLHYLTISLHKTSISEDDYYKGIILSPYAIKQPNIYNLFQVNNINLNSDKENSADDSMENYINYSQSKNNNIIIVKQEIVFYKSVKKKKFLILRFEKSNGNFIEISINKPNVIISENVDETEYQDLSNYNSIFKDDGQFIINYRDLIKVNENNIFIYIFNDKKKLLTIYINNNRLLFYNYKFNFDLNELLTLKIGYPLDLVKEYDKNGFKIYSHIKLKFLKIYLQNAEFKDIIKNIYQMSINSIECEYLFADDLTTFKLDNNSYLYTKYNNILSAKINSVFQKHNIKSQFYQKIFFLDNYLTNSLDFNFRLEKYIFVLLNDINIEKVIFKELIILLCSYLMINSPYLCKFLAKEEFKSALYFSLYRNIKFVDREIIDNLFSFIKIKEKDINYYGTNFTIVRDILLDIDFYNLLNKQIKFYVIDSLQKKVFNEKNNSEYYAIKSNIIEKLAKILIFTQIDENEDNSNNNNNIRDETPNNLDEITINIIFDFVKSNIKDNKLLKNIEELFYILFTFDNYSNSHIRFFNKGKPEQTQTIINTIFSKIHNTQLIFKLKDLLTNKIQPLNLETSIKEKLFRLLKSYNPSIKNSNNGEISDFNIELQCDNNNNNEDDKISNLDDLIYEDVTEEEYNDVIQKQKSEDPILSKTRKRPKTITNKSMFKKHRRSNTIDINILENPIDTGVSLTNNIKISKINKEDENKNTDENIPKMNPKRTSRLYAYDISDYKNKLDLKRLKSSVGVTEDVVFLGGTISGDEEQYISPRRRKSEIAVVISINEKDSEKCKGRCKLCNFLKNLLMTMFQKEINYNLYKNYLLHCFSEIFLFKENLDFKLNFSYHLMKREGPFRIRKKFELRVDKILNNEYDKTVFNAKKKLKEMETNKDIKDNQIENLPIDNINEYEKLFKFYETKSYNLSENLLNFFNLSQIYNLDLLSYFIDKKNKYHGVYNCLSFKGTSYNNALLVIGKEKIKIISNVFISMSHIFYHIDNQINKIFWVIPNYYDLLQDQCTYLSTYEYINCKQNYEKQATNNSNNVIYGKKSFYKKEKGFWVYSFAYMEINEVHKRKFLHQNNALEIFLKNGKSFYLAFNIDHRDEVISKILHQIKEIYQNKIKNLVINKDDDIDAIPKYKKDNEITMNQIIEEVSNATGELNYEIRNDSSSSIKNENMIFLKNRNLFIDINKKKSNKKGKRRSSTISIKQSLITDSKEILEQSYNQWSIGNLDTFSYLMIINTITGRTYNDLGQYPIFPWILNDYETNKINLGNNKQFRDFNYPIYAQNEEVREHLQNKYAACEEDDLLMKYHSGSHYSNTGFVCYYLLRTKPFSVLNAQAQGDCFDTTDRLFFNIHLFYKVDEKYQELIPEMFNVPELFINVNNFDFGLTSKNTLIDNVTLPPWSGVSPRTFCKIMKKSVESKFVSQHINEWIDLIFGYKQKGVEAEKFCNVLREVCSSFNPKKDCENEEEMLLKINEICEMGVDPIQILNKPHRKREKHGKIKAFFGKILFLLNLEVINDKCLVKNFDDFSIKEIYKYKENNCYCVSKGEGGLSSFRIILDDDSNVEKKKEINDDIYFMTGGKKTLIPPSYKNFFEWGDKNNFYLVKPFKNMKYKFTIYHMKKSTISIMKMTKDGKFIIIGYENGIIEKYKLIKFNGPKQKKRAMSNISNKSKDSYEKCNSIPRKASVRLKETKNTKSKMNSKNRSVDKNKNEPKSENKNEGGLFYKLFCDKKNNDRNIKVSEFIKYPDKNAENEKENNECLSYLEDYTKYNISVSNQILLETKLCISASNILNTDCILLNAISGKFIQYNSFPSLYNNTISNNNPENKLKIPGFYAHSIEKINLENLLMKANCEEYQHQQILAKHYVIFLINSSSRILNKIYLVDLCEPYSFMLVVDEMNNLYLFDFNSFDLLKYVDCSIFFENKIKFTSICQYTGDFILASNYKVILYNINGVVITQLKITDSKIYFCLIKSIYLTQSELYLFTGNEDGSIQIWRLINNLSAEIDTVQETYHYSLDTSMNYYNNKKKLCIDKLPMKFEAHYNIRCSKYPIKFIKISADLTSCMCIDSNNHIIYMDYKELMNTKRKNKEKDKKSSEVCKKCNNKISSSKIVCTICGKKLCQNCKSEAIIAEYSLKSTKPICEVCWNAIDMSNTNLNDF